MKSLKFKIDLNCKVAIYVPSTIDVNKETDNTTYVNKVLHDLSLMFGGATTTPAHGAWVCDSGETVIEKIDVVYSFCTSEQLNDKIDEVIDLCEYLKREMTQEAITLEVNGQATFI